VDKRLIKIGLPLVILGLVVWVSNIVYLNFFSPVFTLEANVKTEIINGEEHALSRLIDQNTAYIEDPLAEAEKLKYGRQIGRTNDGMRIYEVKGDSTRVMMTGFMSLQIIFKRE
jgi:hypothetical protein